MSFSTLSRWVMHEEYTKFTGAGNRQLSDFTFDFVCCPILLSYQHAYFMSH